MGAVRIVTDSAADIPPDLASELDITVVPLLVHIGGKSYRDRLDISGEAFYRELEGHPQRYHYVIARASLARRCLSQPHRRWLRSS